MTIRRCKSRDFDPSRPKDEQVWCLYTKDGSRLLGRHPTKESAERQERAIQVSKHSKAALSILAVAVEYDYLPPHSMEDVPEQFQGRYGPFFVHATEIAYTSEGDNDSIVGACDYSWDKSDRTLSLYQILIDPTFRRQGIALTLIGNAITRHKPEIVMYPYDTPEGLKLANQAKNKFTDCKFVIFDVDDGPSEE